MPYYITIESVHGSILLAEAIPTHAEARNAVKILFCLPGIAIDFATIWDTNSPIGETWEISESGCARRKVGL